MPSQTSEPQWLGNLSPEDRQSYEEFCAGIGYVDDSYVPPPSPWEERLLGRALTDVPISDEDRGDWSRWRTNHRLPIDDIVRMRRDLGPERRRINTKKLVANFEAGWCPFYMARCHIVFAAISANVSLGLSPGNEEVAEGRDQIVKSTSSSNSACMENPIKASRRNSKRQLAKDSAQYMSAVVNLIACEGLNTPQLVDVCLERYRRDLSSLTPLSRSKYGVALEQARALRDALITSLTTLRDLAREADAVFDSDDASAWQREFVRFMAPGYERLIGSKLADSKPCRIFMAAAYNSLIILEGKYWHPHLSKDEHNHWRSKIQQALKLDKELDAPNIEGRAPRLRAAPFRKLTKGQSR